MPTSLVVKNGSKILFAMASGDADAGVAHAADDAFALPFQRQHDPVVLLVGSAELGPLVLDGVPRVDQHVDEDLLEASGIGADRGDVFVQVPFHVDSPDFELLAENLERAGDDVGHAHLFQFQVGLSGELAHVVDDFHRPVHVLVHLDQHAVEQAFVDGLLLVDLADEQRADRLDDRQGLVEFVSDAGGHFTQSGHLAGLDQLLLGLQALGDVACGDQKHFSPGIYRGRYADIDEDGVAVLVNVLGLVEDVFVFQPVEIIRLFLLDEHFQKGASGQLVAGKAVDGLHAHVAVQDFVGVGVQYEDRVGDVVEDGVVFLF